MDRDHELAADYAEVTHLIERWEKRKEGRVEGKWYLFEKEGERSGIQQVADEDIEHVIHHWVDLKGWTVTPVLIFKK